MADSRYRDVDAAKPFEDSPSNHSRQSIDSVSSISSTSAVLENIHNGDGNPKTPLMGGLEEKYDVEGAVYTRNGDEKQPSRTVKTVLWAMCGLCLAGWLLALFLFLKNGTTIIPSMGSPSTLSGGSRPVLTINPKAVTFDEVQSGQWFARSKQIEWISGASGEDGMYTERAGGGGKDYLVVEDVRSRKSGNAFDRKTLMKVGVFSVDGTRVRPAKVFPSKDLKHVLVQSERQRNWRHSSTGLYWIFNVATQTAEPLDPANPHGRVQLAQWSPQSDSIVFTRDNNMFLRRLNSENVIQITKDGGVETFNGVPDWVYEEEVFQMEKATWWSENGNYIAFLRTNESRVPEFPLQYFVSRPSGKEPKAGEENYPEEKRIKYPKAGAPNPIVHLKFYDVVKNEVFDVSIAGDYEDDNRLITEVVWAGNDGKVLIRETNRESDTLKVVLIDVNRRAGQTVRDENWQEQDGGWFEVSEQTRFVPSDPSNNRPHDGYIDTIAHEGYLHLGYFTPLDNPKPIVLTAGKWEVVKAPSSVDLKNNLVYFVAAKKGPIYRHVYSVRMDGSDMKALTPDDEEAYYEVSFSTGSGYALLSYKGPDIPYQKIISTPSNSEKFDLTTENNAALRKFASNHDLPHNVYSTVTVDGFELQVVERRPPNFDENKKYPVIFHLYNGPNSQTVDKKFKVDFQAYMASNLGYLVVTVDGRGTGFSGRKLRCAIRGNIGYYESRDQIETAKIWTAKKYVDPERTAIWGWSYGGFTTLKTLEMDGGHTFKYGMAVAPVTDWRFYDSVYTERYMHTPQHNPGGYNNATIHNMTALASNVRFLMMHGVADDNVHTQSSWTLLDKLDLAGVSNYDFHAFPDSDHSIFFHNANRMVYGRKSYQYPLIPTVLF
jgi:dipeptidyl aminopeptidase